MDATDEHQDVTLQSFVCLEGEVVVEVEPVMSEESVLIRCLALEDNDLLQSNSNETIEPDCTEDKQTTEEHVDHPYYYRSRSTGLNAASILCQEEEVSTYELGNVTFKSLMCLGGEVQVSDNSAIPDESILIEDLASGNHSQCKNTPISKVGTDAVSVISQPLGHSYCNWKSLCEDSSTISTADAHDASQKNVAHIVGIQCTPKNTVNLNNQDQADLSEECHGVSSEEGEITFKGLCCSGVEIQIYDLSNMSKMSVLMDNLAEEQSPSCLNDTRENGGPSFADLTPGRKHVDHIYCHAKEKPMVLNISTTENEVCSKSQLSSASLLEKPVITVGSVISPLGNNTEKKYESCCETDASKTVANQESNQHLSVLNGKNNTESSDVVPLSDSDDKYKVPKDDSSVMARKDVEGYCDQQFLPERKEAILYFEENLCSQVAFIENVGLETSILIDKTLGLKDEEIEVMRFCDRSGEAVSVNQDLSSAIALTGSCTPKTLRQSTLSRSVLHDHTAENPMSHLWPELPESPMPPPLLNSTSLANAFSYTPVPQDPPKTKDVEPKMAFAYNQKLLNAPSVLGNGPLQEQLRQMAELLMVASGKMDVPTAAPVNHHNALVGTSPVVMRSACVWSTPVQRMERSVNTSAAIEILKEVDVSDASTSTDSLLWK